MIDVMHKAMKALRSPSMVRRWLRHKIRVTMVLPWWLRVALGWILPPYRHSKFKSLYILTYGRSGSTLLTGYLSMLPGINLRGENYLYMMPFARSDERMAQLGRLHYADRHLTSSPWYGSQLSSYPRFRRQIKRLLLDQMYPIGPIPKTLGFKEIRWWYQLDVHRFDEDLNWLLDLFPKGAVVLLTRDLEKVFAGAWWAEMSEAERHRATEGLHAFERSARQFVSKYPDRAFHVTYEGFTTSPDVAAGLSEFLGLKFKKRLWKKALGQRFSYPSESALTKSS